MSTNNVKVQSVIEAKLTALTKDLAKNEGTTAISDLFIQAYAEAGELQIYDKMEKLLIKIVLFDWVNSEEKSFDEKVSAALKPVLAQMRTKGAFNRTCFLRPFTISLVDEDFNIMEKLLFVDDDTFRTDEPLMHNLKSELDSFLRKLMSDMPK